MNRVLILLGLAAAVALTAWIGALVSRGERGLATAVPHRPDYYLEDFLQTSLDERGAIHRRLKASRMVHFPDDDSSELTDPELELHNTGPRPWKVRAERGWVSSRAEVLVLYGTVEIWRDDADGRRELEVFTRDLRILAKEQYAESDHPTTIRNPTTTTQATGLRADFGARRLELLRDVKTRHDAQRSKS
ncbi:MAG: LPS export ABC transporter periplasmic protein LptC [Gammaproteobacteria bacterium]